MNALDTKVRITELISSLNYDEADKNQLLDFLEYSDYFDAPFTTEYQYSFAGGLAKYSLDVYNTLDTLVTSLHLRESFTADTLIIVGLFHALSKVNYFEPYVKNVKVYKEDGTKFDNLGKYEWEAQNSYKVKDSKDRYTAGDFGFTSYMILSRFIPLRDEEIMALVHYNCGMDNGHSTKDIFEILRSYPLVALLHAASILTLNCNYEQNIRE